MPLVPKLNATGWLACLVEWTQMELTLAGKELELDKFIGATDGIQASHVFSSTAHHVVCSRT